MIVTIWLLILLFGLGATAMGVVVVAIVTRKLWLIPAVGAIVLFGLVGLGLVGTLLVRPTSHSMQTAAIETLPQPPSVVNSVSLPTQTVVHSPPTVAYSSPPLKINVTWLLILGVVLVAAIVRRVFGPRHGHGILQAWPVLVVLGFIGVMIFLRIDSARQQSIINARSAQEAAAAAVPRQLLEARRHAEQLARQQQKELEKQAQIARNDIHELMDQFDQPRIPVSPERPKPPAPPSPAAAPPTPAAPTAPAPTTAAAAMSAEAGGETASVSVETKKTDTKKTTATASQKRKKPKSSNSDGAKTAAQAVAESKPNNDSQKQKSAAEKESKLAAEAPLVSTDPSKPIARPAWIDEPPKRTGNTRREVIATDEYQSVDECYLAGDIYLLLKTWQRMQQLGGHQEVEGLPSITINKQLVTANGDVVSTDGVWVDYRIRELNKMGISADYLRRELVSKDPKNNEPREYMETVERSFGPMKKLYLQIEFSPSFDRELRRHWEARERTERFAMVGVGAGSILGFLGLVFAFLKIDTWTKGYYTKRLLFIGVPAAIIGCMFMLAVLGKFVVR